MMCPTKGNASVRLRYSQFLSAALAVVLLLYCLELGLFWTLSEQHLQSSRLLKSTASYSPLTINRDDGGDRRLHPHPDAIAAPEQYDEEQQYPRAVWKKTEFECLGWVETDDDGEPTGTTRECWQRVRAGDAGYCEVGNRSSGERFHVMHTTALSLKDEARFTCQLARHFTDFRHRAAAYCHDPPMRESSADSKQHGIVMAVYERVLPSAFASVRRLRDVGCSLPVELWFRHDELAADNPVLVLLRDEYGPVRLRAVFDERIQGFNVKLHAVYYSQFVNVLLLDADNFAVRDPAPLFASRAFLETGAAFWPDFWHPGNTIFNLHAQSLAWELLDTEYVDMLEQESGQVLINRRVSRPMLERLLFYATSRPNLIVKLQLVWGDKDLFRLAWLQLQQPFHFNRKRVPGLLGIVNRERQRFCGLTMVQYGIEGSFEMPGPLFLHRNTVKLTGEPGRDRLVWHALEEFPPTASRRGIPMIQSFNGEKLFNETSCFGVKRFANRSDVIVVRDGQRVPWAALETILIRYAQQAYRLLHQADADASVV
jgi:alpha 1,2-mannosyltransferase